MFKINYFIFVFILFSHCSVDTKTGFWKNKEQFNDEPKSSDLNLDQDLTFMKFKENIILYGKNSKFPNIMEN